MPTLFRFILIVFGVSLVNLLQAAEVLIPTQQIKSRVTDRYFVISIGINNYQDDFWPELKWPESDANKVAQALGSNTRYERIGVTLLNQTATLEHVQKVLSDIEKEATARDTVILYLSGHGTLAQDASGEFVRIAVMHDTQQSQLQQTGLSHQWLRHWLDNLTANKKMMILATCNSGVGKSRLPENVSRLIRTHKGLLTPLAEVSEGALVLSAAAKDEAAREDDKLEGDIYTYYLLEALSLYDRNQDGMVSALEAHDYAKEQTWIYTNGKQRPTADAKLIGDADIPLSGRKKGSGLPVLEAYNESMAGFMVEIDGRAKGRVPFAFALSPAGSSVALYAPGASHPLAKYKVDLEHGETISLNDVMNSRPIKIAAAYRQYFWRDDVWKSLAGDSQFGKLEVELGWGQNNYHIGVNFSLPETQQQTIRTNLQAETSFSSQRLFAEYETKLTKLSFALRTEIGLDELDLELKDEISNSQSTYTDQSITYGAGARLKYELYDDLMLTLNAGALWASWSYQDLGSVNGDRYYVAAGLLYQFGLKVRSQW